MKFRTANISQLFDFTDIIDVRSPSEFALDHIPGAINCPVLTDEERVQVGTLYQSSPFEARKLGAALISANMAYWLQSKFNQYNKSWRPLIYCWRGGMRSSAAVTILSQVGWPVHQLVGGYKAYRQFILQQLDNLPQTLHLIVVCGPTGSGKSRFLQALSRAEAQVLDLEALAVHRGSVLGLRPGDQQPSQRYFDTCLWHQLQTFSPKQVVYVEAESRRIGSVSLPDSLYQHMHASECLQINVEMQERVKFLCEDYHFYLQQPEHLIKQLSCLSQVRSKQELEHWFSLIENGQFNELVTDLLSRHYDPLYWRSMHKHYLQLNQAQELTLSSLDIAQLDKVAHTLMQ